MRHFAYPKGRTRIMSQQFTLSEALNSFQLYHINYHPRQPDCVSSDFFGSFYLLFQDFPNSPATQQAHDNSHRFQNQSRPALLFIILLTESSLSRGVLCNCLGKSFILAQLLQLCNCIVYRDHLAFGLCCLVVSISEIDRPTLHFLRSDDENEVVLLQLTRTNFFLFT